MKRLILIFVSIFSIVFASQATTILVNNNGDTGPGTLRQALATAAGDPAVPHVIIFNAAMTININSDLQINGGNHNGITINGFVNGTDGPDVIIRSSGTLNNKMVFNGTVGAKIYGLVFQNLDYGIHLNGATTTQIKGCYFGTNAAGTAIVNGINQAGVYVQNGGITANNIIGGLLTNLAQGVDVNVVPVLNNSERCIFAGCSQKTDAGGGVRVPALLVRDAGGTQVINNYFGVDITGSVKLGNGNQTTKMPLAHSNIYMYNAKNSIIDRNVIAGATGSGIHLENWCDNTKIKGNKIGTNAAGTAAYNAGNSSLSFSNEACGIFIQTGTGIVIGYDGGTIANERNIISGNGGAKHNDWVKDCDKGFSDYNQFGIYTESVISSTIKGNYIGTDVTGNSSGTGNVFGNRAGGLKMVTINDLGNSNSINNVIGGGTTVNERNIISGNGYLWKANDNSSGCAVAPNPSGMTGGHGVLLQYANTSSNTISGNYIGLGADGLTALGNNINGIEIQGAASNNIGTAGVPNYICNNTWGIFLQVDFGNPYVPAANNNIVGNIIGLTPTNVVAGNGIRAGLTEGGGIGMQMGVNGTKIGTAVANGGNVISGNSIGVGIQTNSVVGVANAPTGNILYNNIIGLDPTGTIAKPNTTFGVSISMGGQGTVFPFDNTIGGTGLQANTISSNQQSGVYISHTVAITPTTANSIIGNKIGTTAAGTGDLGNTLQGIQIVNVSKTTITSNTISGNDQNGISLTGSTTNTIQSNTITANSVNGIFLSNSSTNTIGNNTITTNALNGISLTGSSSNTIQTNTINSNTSNGISVAAASASNIILSNTINTNGVNGVVVNGGTSTNNAINQNSFSCNTARGIVLASGGNASYVAPTINGSQTQLILTVPVASVIEVYETDGCATCPSDPTRLQGKNLVATSPLGTSFTFTTAMGFDKTKTYTATASSSASGAHNTSEFSQCYTLCQNPTSVTITGAPLTFCEGGSVTLTATIVGGTGTPTYVWKKDNVVIGGNTATLVATASGSYVVEYSSTNTCSTTPSSAVAVVVNPRPTVNSPATGSVCSGVAQNYTITSSVPSTFTWTRAAVTDITPSTGAGSTASITETLTNATTDPIDVIYLITPTSTVGSCAAVAPFTYTVTVNPKATVPAQTATICSNTAFTVTPTGVPAGTTYTWGAPVITGSVSGALAQTTAQTSISQTLINNLTTVATVVYTVTPKSGTCNGTPFTVTVTVNPKATVIAQTPAAICSGTAFTVTPTPVPAGTTYTWVTPVVTTGSVSGALAESNPQTSISQTLTNNGIIDAIVVYTVTPTSGTCPGLPFTVTVTVKPKATILAQTATICSNTAFTVTPTGVPTGTTYTWGTPVVTGSVSGATPQATAQTSISQTLINNGITDAIVVYTVTPTSGTCNGAPFTVTVTVNPKPTVTSDATDIVCSGDAQNYTITSNVASGFSWSRALVTGISNAAGSGTTNTITEALTNNTNSPVDVIYIITPTATTGSCAGDAFTYTVTVNPKPTVTSALAGTICSGDPQNYTITSNVASGFSWSRALVTGISEAAGSGTTNTITEALTNNTNSPVDVIYIITPTATTGSCAGDAFTYTVTVNPKPTITSDATGTVCSGIAQNYAITSGVASSFSWTRADVTGIDNPAASGSSSTITETLINSTNASIAVEYIITPTSTTGSCPGIAFSYIVTVDPKPVVTITASASTEICLNQPIDLTAIATGFTGGTFEWFSGSTSLGNENPLTVSAAGSYYVVYTSAASCASAPSTTVDITITPDVTDPIVPGPFSSCIGTATLTGNVPLVGTPVWSVELPSSAVLTPGATPNIALASNLIDGELYTFVYTISNACSLKKASVIVHGGLDNLIVTASGPTDTLCVKTNRALSANASGGSGNFTYIWVSSDGSFSSTGTSGNVTVQPTAGGETVYTVYALDNSNPGCKTAAKDVPVHAVESQDLDIPNLITPNGDNKNDIFILRDKVTKMDIISEGSHIEVVNRWGSKVYEANNYENNWVPKELTDGIYYYHITTTCGDKEYKSWLQILGNTNN